MVSKRGKHPDRYFVGMNADPVDPSVAIVKDGHVIAYAEEERFVRQKHAVGHYPSKALSFCLETVGIGPNEVEAVADELTGWQRQTLRGGSIGRRWRAGQSNRIASVLVKVQATRAAEQLERSDFRRGAPPSDGLFARFAAVSRCGMERSPCSRRRHSRSVPAA